MRKVRLVAFGACMVLILSGHAFGKGTWNEAIKSGNVEKVKELIESGTDINARLKSGETPLVMAVDTTKEHVETVTVLLKAGADPKSKSRQGIPAIVLAAIYGHSDVIKSLLDHGAIVDARDSFGFTALMTAAGTGREDVVKQLLIAGADINAQTEDGFTPQNVAFCRNRDKIVNLLRLEGAKIDKDQLIRVKGQLRWGNGSPVKEAALLMKPYLDGKVRVIFRNRMLFNPACETDSQGRFELKLPLNAAFKGKSSKFIIETTRCGYKHYLLRNDDGALIVHEFRGGEGIVDLGSITVK